MPCASMRKVASVVRETAQAIRKKQPAKQDPVLEHIRKNWPAQNSGNPDQEILELYQDGFDHIGEDLSIPGPQKAQYYPLWIRANREIAGSKKHNPPDINNLLACYEKFFDAVIGLPEITSSAMIGGAVGHVLKAHTNPHPHPHTHPEKIQPRKDTVEPVVVEEIEEVHVGTH